METLNEIIGELQGKLKMNNIEYILPSIVFYYSSMNYVKKLLQVKVLKCLMLDAPRGMGYIS